MSLLQVKAEKPAWYLGVISGALIRCQDYVSSLSTEYLGYLEKGQLPPARLTLTAFQDSLILDGRRKKLDVSQTVSHGLFRYMHLEPLYVSLTRRLLHVNVCEGLPKGGPSTKYMVKSLSGLQA